MRRTSLTCHLVQCPPLNLLHHYITQWRVNGVRYDVLREIVFQEIREHPIQLHGFGTIFHAILADQEVSVAGDRV